MSGDETRQPLSAGTEVRAAVEAGEAAAQPTPIRAIAEDGSIETVHVSTVPWGGEQVIFDPEEYQAAPRRRGGIVYPQTVQSFVDYVARHADTLTTTVWVDMVQCQVCGVLNDHGNDDGEGIPGWGDHRARLRLALTPEWEHWASKDGALVSQEQFAEHIEDGIREIVDPDAASMLEIAQTFTARTDAQFRQATRLTSGEVQFRYDEQTTANAGTNGQLDVPSTFLLGIAPFLGEEPYQVTARLRYRVKSGSLLIGYKLDRPHVVLRDAIERIAEKVTDDRWQTFIGQPR